MSIGQISRHACFPSLHVKSFTYFHPAGADIEASTAENCAGTAWSWAVRLDSALVYREMALEIA